MILKITLRELLRSWKFVLFFVLNLSFGLTGFITLQTYKEAIESNLQQNAKSILAADLSVSARREMTEDEVRTIREVVATNSAESVVYDFFAMLSTDSGSRLVYVKAIDDLYPLYGSLIVDNQEIISTTNKTNLQNKGVWIYPELAAQLNMNTGSQARLGQLDLKVLGVVDKDGTQTFRAASIAPKIFIHRSLLKESGLIQFGSTFTVSYLYKLNDETRVNSVKELLLTKITDPAIQIETPSSAAEDSGRQLGYLSDYLGLVAIIALFMSILGAAYIYRMYLSSKVKDIAILKTLGVLPNQTVTIYILQSVFLGLLAAVLTLIFSRVVIPILNSLLASLVPFTLSPTLSPVIALTSLFIAILGSLFISTPFIIRIRQLKTSQLFSEEQFSQDLEIKNFWIFVPVVFFFWLFSVYQSHSWFTGSVFIIAIFAVVVLLLLLGLGFFKLLAKFAQFKKWFFKYSLLGLERNLSKSFSVFIAIGLASLLMNILPQLKNTLQAEFEFNKESKLPSLFLFDIQDEQLKPIQDYFQNKNIPVLSSSPMIRARILKVNGQSYERKLEGDSFKTREEERDARFRNRGVNLSYREKLSDTETIYSGEFVSKTFDSSTQKYPALSLEYKYAERVGLKIGDVLEFDVQGVEISGQVTSLRKVRWTSFQPNFFILFQPGVLEEAPKIHITSVSNLDERVKNEVQNGIANMFANISIIDVSKTVTDVLQIADQMSWSLELMSVLALISGYVVLFSIIRTQLRKRRWELNMLKILGAGRGDLLIFVCFESFVVTLSSAFFGAFLSVFVSFALSSYIFQTDFHYQVSGAVLSVVIILLLSLFISILAALDIINEKPLDILKGEN